MDLVLAVESSERSIEACYDFSASTPRWTVLSISARQLIGRRARAVTRNGGLRPTYRQRLASDAACCA